MDLIELNIRHRRNLGKVVSDTRTTFDKLTGLHKDGAKMSSITIEYLKVYGICVRKLSNGTVVVYWVDDDRVDNILDAAFAELPEFLTDGDYEVRLLAMYRLDELNK